MGVGRFSKVSETLGIIRIAKAASSSILSVIRSKMDVVEGLCINDFLKLPERIAFIREPHDRIESTYKQFIRWNNFGPYPLGDFNEFVLSVCKNPLLEELHVPPMHHALFYGGEYIPTRTIKWDFDELAKVLGVSSIPHEHKASESHHTAWTEEAKSAFEVAYKEDLELWAGR